MMRHVWTAEELRAILAGLAITAETLPEPQRTAYAQALASMAAILGLWPNGQQLTEASLKSGFLTGF